MNPDPDRLRVRVVRSSERNTAECRLELVNCDGYVQRFTIDTGGDTTRRGCEWYAKQLRRALRKHDASVRAAAIRRGR
jgi:hypothetical protein